MNLFTHIFRKETKDEKIFRVICRLVSKEYHLKLREIFSESRKGNICQARQLIQFFAIKYTNFSMGSIGEKTNRQRSDIYNSEKSITNAMLTDKKLFKRIFELDYEIKKRS